MSEGNRTFYYQACLRKELLGRIERNPRYSLRSFATALGVNSSDLSQIMAGRRAVSIKLVDRIISYLELSADEQKKFVESVLDEKKQKGLKRISPALVMKLKSISESASASGPQVRGVGLDEFRVIADWYHYAILEMTFAKNFKADPKWIAKELNISVLEARVAIERLQELELLEVSDGIYKKTSWHIDMKDRSKTSLFQRRRQKQILEKSIHSLEHDPIEERCHSSLTFCLDPKNIQAAKIKIQKVLMDLAGDLTNGNQERVYELNLSLFPLQRRNENETK